MIFFSRTVFLGINPKSKWLTNLLKQPCRFFGGLDTSPSSVMRNPEVQTIHTETVNVSNGGRLEVRCPFNMYVSPIHQKEFPRLDKAFFTVYGDSGFKFSKETWSKLFKFSSLYNAESRILHVFGEFTELGEKQLSDQAHTLEVYCQIPPHYEIDVICTDNNNVNVEYLQSPAVHIQTKRGECLLKNVVAESIVVHSRKGNITCFGSLHGAIDLSTARDGIIQGSKLQGSYVRLKVENGDINFKSLDSEHFHLQGQEANFHLRHLHGHGIVDLHAGSIDIGSVDGDINVRCEEGNVSVFFTSTDRSKIRVQQGDVKLGVIDNANVHINLAGKRVHIAEDVEHFHREIRRQDGIVRVKGFLVNESADSTIDVDASKGTIEFSVRDWFSTLKLDQHVDQ